MSRNSNLAKIHIAKKSLGMDDAVYREFLKGLTGKDSAGAMTPTEHAQVIREMRKLGGLTPTKESVRDATIRKGSPFGTDRGTGGPKKFDELGLRPGKPSPATLRMIEALWHQVSRANDEKLALRHFLFKRYGVDDIKFLDFDSAEKCKEALKSMSHPSRYKPKKDGMSQSDSYRIQGGRW